MKRMQACTRAAEPTVPFDTASDKARCWSHQSQHVELLLFSPRVGAALDAFAAASDMQRPYVMRQSCSGCCTGHVLLPEAANAAAKMALRMQLSSDCSHAAVALPYSATPSHSSIRYDAAFWYVSA
jgi:hypothetical protein